MSIGSKKSKFSRKSYYNTGNVVESATLPGNYHLDQSNVVKKQLVTIKKKNGGKFQCEFNIKLPEYKKQTLKISLKAANVEFFIVNQNWKAIEPTIVITKNNDHIIEATLPEGEIKYSGRCIGPLKDTNNNQLLVSNENIQTMRIEKKENIYRFCIQGVYQGELGDEIQGTATVSFCVAQFGLKHYVDIQMAPKKLVVTPITRVTIADNIVDMVNDGDRVFLEFADYKMTTLNHYRRRHTLTIIAKDVDKEEDLDPELVAAHFVGGEGMSLGNMNVSIVPQTFFEDEFYFGPAVVFKHAVEQGIEINQDLYAHASTTLMFLKPLQVFSDMVYVTLRDIQGNLLATFDKSQQVLPCLQFGGFNELIPVKGTRTCTKKTMNGNDHFTYNYAFNVRKEIENDYVNLRVFDMSEKTWPQDVNTARYENQVMMFKDIRVLCENNSVLFSIERIVKNNRAEEEEEEEVEQQEEDDRLPQVDESVFPQRTSLFSFGSSSSSSRKKKVNKRKQY